MESYDAFFSNARCHKCRRPGSEVQPPTFSRSPGRFQAIDDCITDWFLVGNGGMGYWDYYRGP